MKTRRAKATFMAGAIVVADGSFLLLRELGARPELMAVTLTVALTAIGLGISAFWEMPDDPPWWVRSRPDSTDSSDH
jgi:hypothetical protein